MSFFFFAFINMSEGRPATSALIAAALNIANTLATGGASIVPLAYTVRQVGIPTAICIFLICAIWSASTGWSLMRASELSGCASYEECARTTFGLAGMRVVQFFITLNAFGVCVSLLDVWGDVAPLTVSGFTRIPALLVAGVISFPAVAFVRRFDTLAPLSLFATAMTALFCVNVFVAAARGPLDGLGEGAAPSGATAGKQFESILNAFSVGILIMVYTDSNSDSGSYSHFNSDSGSNRGLVCLLNHPLFTSGVPL
jgi:hypothetical protein